VADMIWQALGQPKHYMEPFFGSGAVLLARPDYDPAQHIETVCDADGYVANAWRAMQFAPDQVARWCDWPINHADLSARKKRLIENERYLLDNLIADEAWYDAKLAGYWIWAASCWIGSGLTSIGQRPHLLTSMSKRPDLADGGKGVHRQSRRPGLSHTGFGVHKISKRPHLGKGGVGVHKLSQRPSLADISADVRDPYNENIYAWFRELSERLRYVRVVCGDWTRICGGNWQDAKGPVGIFFDPPYGVQDRDQELYHHESVSVAHDVRQWCLERGNKPSYRIVLAGYDEHEELLTMGWTARRWKACGGYGNNAGSQGKQNRHRETLYFSPHCVSAYGRQAMLF